MHNCQKGKNTYCVEKGGKKTENHTPKPQNFHLVLKLKYYYLRRNRNG